LFDLELSMRYETLTLGGNVIRFPVELRAKPSINLLIDVAPDSREVELIAETFGFDAPDPEGRAKADRAMAERIAFPKEGRHNSLALDPGQTERKERRERKDLPGPERQHLRPRWRTINSTSDLTTAPTSSACL
jgi:hypothetical protein